MGNQSSTHTPAKESVETLKVGTNLHETITRKCAFCNKNRFTDQEVSLLTDSNTQLSAILETYNLEKAKTGEKTGYTVSMEDDAVKLEYFVCNCENFKCAVDAFKVSGGQNKIRYYGKPEWKLEQASPFKIAVNMNQPQPV